MATASCEAGVPLTNTQAIEIHGWWNPTRRLTWTQVKSRDDLNFRRLYAIMLRGSDPVKAATLLHVLQPDLRQWLQTDKANLQDCEVLHVKWDVDFARDFPGQSMGNVILAQLSFEAMRKCRMTVDALIERAGMTPESMSLLHLTCREWAQLGLRRCHIHYMSDALVAQIFRAPRHVVEGELPLDVYLEGADGQQEGNVDIILQEGVVCGWQEEGRDVV